MKKLTIIILTIILLGCTLPDDDGGMEEEYIIQEPEEDPPNEPPLPTDIIADPNNLIPLSSDDIVIFNNGYGHFDNWFLPEGMTFEIKVIEVDDYFRFWNTPDFIVSSDRIYAVGEGKYHYTDFNCLHPPMSMYYFSIEVTIDGVSSTYDCVVDSN